MISCSIGKIPGFAEVVIPEEKHPVRVYVFTFKKLHINNQ